ncbi:MAG: nuclear transport factor 2 family protein [Deltaproteobacteria bacterium]|nr:nuclear transport factor 2 family protein [Deltaproteobacteria bacterium]
MHPNQRLIERFYQAFKERDGRAMGACYHDQVHFSDPVFVDLHGEQARGMWRMLCERGKDLVVEASRIEANEERGIAHWDAFYTFSATGQKVHNIIDAEFRFQDGLIIDHRDRFDLYRWARQALGIKGLLLGWAPPVQNAVRKQAMKGLDAFLKKGG